MTVGFLSYYKWPCEILDGTQSFYEMNYGLYIVSLLLDVFSVSILSKATPLKFISLFGFRSGREVDKFKDINHKFGVTGTTNGTR